jgi:hypothetical protein
MMIKRNISIKNIYLLFFTLLISCDNKLVNFDEYIKNSIFNGKEILDDKIYVIEKIKSEVRITYTELGTFLEYMIILINMIFFLPCRTTIGVLFLEKALEK